MTRVLLAASCALTMAVASPAGAQVRRPLPVVELLTLEESPAPALQREGRWLLVYVKPDSAPSQALLSQCRELQPETAGRMVVIVGGTPAQAREMAGSQPALAGATWVVDPANDAFRALKLTGVPVLLGIRRASVEWSQSGSAKDPPTLLSILTSWTR